MRRRSFIGSAVSAPPGAVDKSAATVGSICIANGTDIYFMSLSAWQAYSGTEYQAIGVVTSAVGDCGDSYVRVCSISYMNCDTPDVGSLSYQLITWNGYNTIIGGGITETTVENTAKANYHGKKNTTAILAKATAQADWRTSSTITNYIYSSTNAYYPAACCCWRFHTLGTVQGDWYLPALGELHKFYQNKSLIEPSLKALGMNEAYSTFYWSSTSYNSAGAWVVDFVNDAFLAYNRSYGSYVRAFFAF